MSNAKYLALAKIFARQSKSASSFTALATSFSTIRCRPRSIIPYATPTVGCVGWGSRFWVSWARVLGWWLVEFSHWLICWVGVLGRWWCRGCGDGWLIFGLAVFLALVGWVLFSVLLKILSFFFFFLFCWGFWIWNLLEDLVIVVVVYGDWFAIGGGLVIGLLWAFGCVCFELYFGW